MGDLSPVFIHFSCLQLQIKNNVMVVIFLQPFVYGAGPQCFCCCWGKNEIDSICYYIRCPVVAGCFWGWFLLLFFNRPCVHKIAVNLILVQNCLSFIVLSVSFIVMLQSVYLFKERVLIVLGLFVQPGIVLHTHCTVQDSQDSVFQSLCHLMMLLTQGFSHGCICFIWLFQPMHGCFSQCIVLVD